jgi:hypothetical protein
MSEADAPPSLSERPPVRQSSRQRRGVAWASVVWIGTTISVLPMSYD